MAIEKASRMVMPDEYVLRGSLIKSPQLGKIDDNLLFLVTLVPVHSDERAVHVDVLKSGHFPVDRDRPAVRDDDTGKDL
jgi:hypothetical protein